MNGAAQGKHRKNNNNNNKSRSLPLPHFSCHLETAIANVQIDALQQNVNVNLPSLSCLMSYPYRSVRVPNELPRALYADAAIKPNRWITTASAMPSTPATSPSRARAWATRNELGLPRPHPPTTRLNHTTTTPVKRPLRRVRRHVLLPPPTAQWSVILASVVTTILLSATWRRRNWTGNWREIVALAPQASTSRLTGPGDGRGVAAGARGRGRCGTEIGSKGEGSTVAHDVVRRLFVGLDISGFANGARVVSEYFSRFVVGTRIHAAIMLLLYL